MDHRADGIKWYPSKDFDPIDLLPEEVLPWRPGIPITYPTYLAPQYLTYPGSVLPLYEEPSFDTYDDYKPDIVSEDDEASQEDDGHELEDDEDHDKGKEQQPPEEDLGTKPEVEGSFILKRHRQDIDPAISLLSTASGTKPEVEGKFILKRHRQDIDPAILSVSTASGTKPEVEGKSILKRHRQDIDPAISSVSTASGTKP